MMFHLLVLIAKSFDSVFFNSKIFLSKSLSMMYHSTCLTFITIDALHLILSFFRQFLLDRRIGIGTYLYAYYFKI